MNEGLGLCALGRAMAVSHAHDALGAAVPDSLLARSVKPTDSWGALAARKCVPLQKVTAAPPIDWLPGAALRRQAPTPNKTERRVRQAERRCSKVHLRSAGKGNAVTAENCPD